MIPYIELHRIWIGPVPIQIWGLFVASGIVLAVLVAVRLADGRGVARAQISDAATVIVLGAFLGARLLHVTVYDWAYYSRHIWDIFFVWKGGLSSFGGFVGGTLAGLWFLQRRRLPRLASVDIILTALPLGWMVGRIGCFLIHDHPGTLTHSLFGVRYPGGARFDLGLVESVIGGAVFMVGLLVYRRWAKQLPGLPTAAVLVSYGLLRFVTDFLRATDLPGSDPRLWGLTPAQYGAAVLVALGGVWGGTLLIKRKKT